VYFKELVVDVDWFHMAQYRLVWQAVMNIVKKYLDSIKDGKNTSTWFLAWFILRP
jgi:hypothetical protein